MAVNFALTRTWTGAYRKLLQLTITLVTRIVAANNRLPPLHTPFYDGTIWSTGTTVPIALQTLNLWAATLLNWQSARQFVEVAPPSPFADRKVYAASVEVPGPSQPVESKTDSETPAQLGVN